MATKPRDKQAIESLETLAGDLGARLHELHEDNPAEHALDSSGPCASPSRQG